MELLDAETIQRSLARLGYWDRVPDGNLHDEDFVEALRKFQRDVDTKRDGMYGEKTNLKLRPYVELFAKAPSNFLSARRWKLTAYYIADESEYTGQANVPVYDDQRNVLARVSAKFFANMSLEGDGHLTDGRLLRVTGNMVNVTHGDYQGVLDYAQTQGWLPDKPKYAGISVIDERVREAFAFSVVPASQAGLGYGQETRTSYTTQQRLTIAKEPFRTVAADLGLKDKSDPQFKGQGGVVDVGVKVWIMELVGLRLADGTVHDGWCTVNDTGGGIYGAHFDVFTGSHANARKIPDHAHIWFDGIEAKLPFTYSYGL